MSLTRALISYTASAALLELELALRRSASAVCTRWLRQGRESQAWGVARSLGACGESHSMVVARVMANCSSLPTRAELSASGVRKSAIQGKGPQEDGAEGSESCARTLQQAVTLPL